jgi:hypothetical protein
MTLDDCLPDFQVRTRHSIAVNASAEQTYAALLASDFSEVWSVRTLMRIRRFGRRASVSRAARSLPERLQGTGFMLLNEEAGKRIIAGVVGKFWRPSSGIRRDVHPTQFSAFKEPGFARAGWLFEIVPIDAVHCTLNTETRVQCFGRSAHVAFKTYWLLVGPFSGMIRTAILRTVKRRAETANIR